MLRTQRGQDAYERWGTKANGSSLAKNEIFQIDTSNILFIMSGAFEGLDKVIEKRIAKGVRHTIPNHFRRALTRYRLYSP